MYNSLKQKLQLLIEESENDSQKSISIRKLKTLLQDDFLEETNAFSTENTLKNLLDNMPDSLLITDLEDKIIYANKTCLQTSGYSFEELKDKEAYKLFVSTDNSFMDETLEKRKKGKVSSYEVLQKRKDGTDWWSYVYGVPYKNKNNEIIGTIGFMKETTQLRASNQTLKLLNERYEDLFENINDGLIIFNAKGDFIKMNPKAKEILGYDEKVEKINVMDIMHEEPQQKTEFYSSLLIKSGGYTNYEGQVITKDGGIKDIEVSASAIFQDGLFAGSRNIIRDITERKKIEQRLNESLNYQKVINFFVADNLRLKSEEDILLDVVENCHEILDIEDCTIYIYDEKNKVLYNKTDIENSENPAFKQNQLSIKIGKGIIGTVALTQEPNVNKGRDTAKDNRIDKMLKQSRLTIPIVYEDKLIGVIDAKHKAANFFNQAYLEIFESIASILAIKISESRSWEKIKEREERLSLALSSGKLGTWDWNIQTGEKKYDGRWASMLGFSLKELEKEKITFHQLLHKDDLEKSKKHVKQHLKGNIEEINQDIRLKTKTGKYKWIRDIGKVVELDAQNTPIRALGLHQDISVLKEDENYKNSLLKSLERANNELRDYAYVVSHDLKAPLRGINALVTWLLEDYADKFDEEGKTNIHLIQERVEKMDELIEGILEYSALDIEDEAPKLIELKVVINNIIKTINIPDNIKINIDDSIPALFINRTRMIQLFQNLISNSIKYIDKKSGVINISAKELEDFWLFKVKDNGIGIEEQYHKKVFQIFQKLDTRKSSTGLGLSIVKKIIDIYKGNIWIESEMGKGTTFYFTIKK